MRHFLNVLLPKLPVLFLILFTLIIFSPVLIGKLPVPADTIVGLYHPWRDQLAGQYPNGAPFKNFLITDPVRQQYPWRQLSVTQILSGKLPVWNPYSFSGTPLIANFQSAVFYPLNIFLFLFGMTNGWTIMIIGQILLGGCFMWIYLRSLKLHPLATALGTLSWVGSGFWVAWLEWNTLIQTILWLPLLLFTIDKIFFSPRKIVWLTVFTLVTSLSLLAGHLQTFFYLVLVLISYLLARLGQTKQYRVLPVFLIPLLFFLLFTFVQWWPFLNFLILSARDVDPQVLTRPDWFLPLVNLSQFLAPDFLGNPATLNYFGIWNYMEFVGYLGVGGLFFALYSLIFRRDKKTLFFLILLFTGLIFALPTPLAQIPFLLRVPLLSSAQPSRLLVVIDFSLAMLAALGLDHYLKSTPNLKNLLRPVILFTLSLTSLWVIAFLWHSNVSLRNLIYPTIFTLAIYVLIYLGLIRKRFLQISVVLILLVVIFDLSRFSAKFESFSPREWLFPPTTVTQFLQEKAKNEVFRVAALDDRILPPNFSLMYGIQSVSGYDPLYLRRYGEFIASLEQNKSMVGSYLNFNRIVTPKNYLNPAFSLLNVKYYLSLSDIDRKNFFLVFREGETRVYEDKNTLPRTFFVETVFPTRSPQETMAVLLKQNSFQKSVSVEGFKIDNTFQSFSPGVAVIKKYLANEVLIQTKNVGQGFLVLLDSYYPDWKASVDGAPTKIYITDYTFRGVIIPAGEHIVKFYL